MATRSTAVGIAASVVAAILLAGGGTATSSTLTPSTEGPSGRVIAIVSEVPVSLGRITRAEFQRALAEQAAAADRDPVPKPGVNGYERLKDATMGDLLELVFIHGQADAMGIAVTPRRVSRELASIKRQSFESEAEYHRFLRDARYTRRDVRERVELQLLTTAIQRRVERRVRGLRQKLEAFSAFVEAYSERWRARTICAPEYETDRCSNGPPPGDFRLPTARRMRR